MKKHFLLLLIVCTLSGAEMQCYAQFYSETIYTTKDGLKSNVIKDLIQTKDGHLWMINAGELCKFDGKDFTYYPLKSDILNYVSDIDLTELTTGEIMLRSTEFIKFNPKNESFTYYGKPHKDALKVFETEDWFNFGAYLSNKFDKYGNVWSSNKHGIYKFFNGKTLNVVGKIPGLTTTNYPLFFDYFGDVWVTTTKSFLKIQDSTLLVCNIEGFDTSTFIPQIKLVSTDGGVLFTDNYGKKVGRFGWENFDENIYYTYKNKIDTLTFKNEKDQLFARNSRDIREVNGQLLFKGYSYTFSKELLIYNLKSNTYEKIKLDNNFSSIYSTLKGSLILYTKHTSHFRTSWETTLSILNESKKLSKISFPKRTVYNVIEDNEGNIWTVTDKGLVKYSLSSTNFKPVIDYNSRPVINHYNYVIDNNENLWYSSRGSYYDKSGNLALRKRYLFKYNTIAKKLDTVLKSDNIFHLEWDNINNSIWVKSNDNFWEIKNEIISKINIDIINVKNLNFHLKQGTYYSEKNGTNGEYAISRFNKAQNKFELFADDYVFLDENQNAPFLFKDKEGSEIAIINKRSDSVEYILTVDSNEWIVSATIDSRSNYWIFTDKAGKLYYDSPQLKIKQENAFVNSGEENRFTSAFSDNNGNLWATTNMGLNFFTVDHDTIKTELITKKHGLSTTVINDLYIDKNNILWIATINGIDKLDINEYLETRSINLDHFGEKEGLKDLDCWGFETRNNQLIVSTESGYAIIDDTRELTTLIAPNPYFTSLGYSVGGELKLDPRFLGEEVGFDNPFGPIYIGYNAIKFNNTKPLQYNAILYKSGKLLYGSFDNINWKTQEEIKYENLAPGNYKVELFCRVGAKGVKSEPTILEFKIIPAWWQTWWFKGLIILSILAFLYLLFKWRTNALIKRQKQLEQTVTEKTAEANHERDVAKEKTNEIIDSLNYAKRLQEAILPSPRLVKEWLTESFIFYKPKDIVAGDFYWMETVTNNSPLEGGKGDVEPNKQITGQARNDAHLIFFAAADCTGHGVPGAMVSVVCANALNRAVKEFRITDPGLILDKVSELVVEAFEKSDEEIKDGMDIALCALDMSRKILYYSGAHNSLYRITKRLKDEELLPNISVTATHKLLEYKATKRPIGAHFDDTKFTTQEIKLEPGDSIYLFSDGFADQFGGAKGKKLKYKPFRELLLENHEKPMEEQKTILSTVFDNWKGNLEQIDDVCIIGVKVNGIERNNFTKSELKVLACLQEGLSSKLIADKLNLSKNTIDTYRRRLFAKTGTYNATELINYCVKKEIV